MMYKLRVSDDNPIRYRLRVSGQQRVPAQISTPINVQVLPAELYKGEYIITPMSAIEQILETEGKIMTDNVTIEPIPSNYGLITWNGSVLTVS